MGWTTKFLTLKRGPAPKADPQERELRLYADEGGALRTILHDGTDSPVAGAGSLPSPTDEGDVLTVSSGEWAGEPPSGGSTPHGQETAGGGAGATIPDMSQDLLPWVHVAGDALLDYTDPTNPTFIAEGTYAVTIYASMESAVPASGSWSVLLAIDPDDTNAQAITTQELHQPGNLPTLGLCVVWYVEAGAKVNVIAANLEGLGDALLFKLEAAYVQQLGS